MQSRDTPGFGHPRTPFYFFTTRDVDRVDIHRRGKRRVIVIYRADGSFLLNVEERNTRTHARSRILETGLFRVKGGI
jgi:hypothetical protein